LEYIFGIENSTLAADGVCMEIKMSVRVSKLLHSIGRVIWEIIIGYRIGGGWLKFP